MLDKQVNVARFGTTVSLLSLRVEIGYLPADLPVLVLGDNAILDWVWDNPIGLLKAE